MIVFKSIAEMHKAFAQYIDSVGDEAVALIVEAAANSIETAYRNLPYPLQINGQEISRVPPAEIAAAVQASAVGKSGLITIDPSKADAEWSARRYAALAANGNPFSNLTLELKSGQRMSEITGLKTHP